MKLKTLFYCTLIFWLAIFTIQCNKRSIPEIPHLEKRGTATQLIVDGKPFLVLGGELHNSSSSSLEYMRPIWPKLAAMHLNTVLAVVSWDLVEPEEGKFDFSLVDGLIQDARQHNLRLMILWFGSWKNGQSHYIPAWVKKDFERFPRVRIDSGKSLEILSTLSEENVAADARAFAALMRHIREVDSKVHTVIMIQVQNEVGILGDSRDRCAAANEAFGKPVPKELMDYLREHKDTLIPDFRKVWEAAGFKTSGIWEEVFGTGPATDEIFMAWNYACYIGRMAEAGKAEYPLPMFVNAWIVQPQDKRPGDYPSGGPVDHVHDVWRAGAPQVDILAPDIYLPNFAEICKRYSRSGNPLFIPESRAGAQGAGNVFYAIGQNNAIGYSPFGIDSRVADPENGPIHQSYDVLSQLAPLILEGQSKGTIAGVSLNQENLAKKIQLGNYTLEVELRRTRRSTILPDLGYGVFISVGPDEYVVAGNDIQISFTPNTPGPAIAGLASVEEGNYKDNQWIPGRRLNGDAIMLDYDLSAMALQNKTGSGLKFRGDGPGIQRVKLYRYR